MDGAGAQGENVEKRPRHGERIAGKFRGSVLKLNSVGKREKHVARFRRSLDSRNVSFGMR